MTTKKPAITFYLENDLTDWLKSLPNGCNRTKEINLLLRVGLAASGDASVSTPSDVPQATVQSIVPGLISVEPAPTGNALVSIPENECITCKCHDVIQHRLESWETESSLLEADIKEHDSRITRIETEFAEIDFALLVELFDGIEQEDLEALVKLVKNFQLERGLNALYGSIGEHARRLSKLEKESIQRDLLEFQRRGK
jgi:hypothetical protein